MLPYHMWGLLYILVRDIVLVLFLDQLSEFIAAVENNEMLYKTVVWKFLSIIPCNVARGTVL